MSTETHPQPEAFRRLLQGQSSRGENRAIIRHLLAGCSDCGERLEAARPPRPDPMSWSYDDVFARLERELVGSPEAPAAPRHRLRLVHSARGAKAPAPAAVAVPQEEPAPMPVAVPVRRAHKR